MRFEKRGICCCAVALLVCCLGVLALADGDGVPLGKYVEQDGVLYFVGDDQAQAIKIMPDAEALIFLGNIEGKPVHLEPALLRVPTRAKTMRFEEGLVGLTEMRLEHWEALEQVDLFFETHFKGLFDPDESQIELLDCPNISALRVHGEQLQQTLGIVVMSCPALSEVSVSNGYQYIYYQNNAKDKEAEVRLTIPASVQSLALYDQTVSVQIDPENAWYELLGGVLYERETSAIAYYPSTKEDKHFRVPEGVTSVKINNHHLESLHISKSVQYLSLNCESLKHITLAEDNPFFSLRDGVVYSADGRALAYYPQVKTNTYYAIEESVTGNISITNPYLTHLVLKSASTSDGGNTVTTKLDCSALETIELPADYAFEKGNFDSLPSLKTIIMEEGEGDFRTIDGSVYTKDGEVLVFVPQGKEGTFSIAEGTVGISHERRERYKDYKLFYSAFEGCNKIEKVVFPKSIEEISSDAFEENLALREFEVAPGNPYYISKDGAVFSVDGNTLIALPIAGRTHITLPAGIETVGAQAVPHNRVLQSITVPSGVRVLENRAFAGSLALEQISLPFTLERVGDYAFEDCNSLKKVNFPEGVEQIGYAFSLSFAMETRFSDYGREISTIEIGLPMSLRALPDDALVVEDKYEGRTRDEVRLVVPRMDWAFARIYANENNIPHRLVGETSVRLLDEKIYAMLKSGQGDGIVRLYKTPDMQGGVSEFFEGGMVELRSVESDGWLVVYPGWEKHYVPDTYVHLITQPEDILRLGFVWRDTTVKTNPSNRETNFIYPLLRDTIVVVNRRIGPWYEITGIGRIGLGQGLMRYVPARDVQFLSMGNDVHEASIRSEDDMLPVPVMELPAENAPVVKTCLTGEIVKVYCDDGEWSFVETDREKGFVRTEFLLETSALREY